MNNRFATLLGLLTMSGLLSAAGIDGTWTAEAQTQKGKQIQTLTLKSNGEKLTGTLSGGQQPVEISDGVIHGNQISFKIVRDGGDKGKREQTLSGTLSGDELRLGPAGGGGKGKGERVFKRAQ